MTPQQAKDYNLIDNIMAHNELKRLSETKLQALGGNTIPSEEKTPSAGGAAR